MKKLLLMLLVMIPLFAGCSLTGVEYKYSYKFDNNNDKVSGEISDSSLSNMKYSDNWINIIFNIEDKSIGFSLENKTDSTQKIIWDETAIIISGISHRIIHNGTKYINRNDTQLPTSIPPHTSIIDDLIPSENIYFYSYWQAYDLFKTHDFNKEKYREEIKANKGKKFSLYLPIQCQGKTIGYNFNFTITDVKPVNN